MSEQPNTPSNPAQQNIRDSSPSSPGAAVVMVVEDDPWIRKAVGRKLQSAGLEVILVPSASDALIVAQRTAFHVLVLDLHLPDDTDPFFSIHDGFAMLDWLKRNIGAFRFNIVVHTSQRSDDVLMKAEDRGVFAVCYKKRELDTLLQFVLEALDNLRLST